MNLARLAALALLVMPLGCSGAEPDTRDTGAPLHAQAGGYGYEFVDEKIGPTAAPAAPVSAVAPGPGGRLAPEAIRDVVRARAGSLSACYATALAASPGLSGTMSVRFQIHDDGAPSAVQVEHNTMAGAALSACVTAAFTAMSFPVSTGGTATVVYPLQFAP